MAEKQRDLHYDRKSNFANLELAVQHLRDWCDLPRKGLAKRLETLLKQVDFCTGATGCNARAEVLAPKCGMTRRNLQRLINDAVALELLERQTSISVRTGGQGANRLRVRWERVEAIADRYRTPATTPAPGPKPRGHDVRPRGHDVRPRGHDVRAYKRNLTHTLDPSLNPPPPPRPPAGWGEVEEALVGYGVKDWSPAVAACRKAGCGPELVLAAIAFAASKPGAWGPGALRHRLLGLRPDQEPTDERHWLPVSEKYARRAKAVSHPPVAAADRAAEHAEWERERRAKGLPV